MRNSSYRFGIFSGPSQWGNVFGSYDAAVDSSIPLWLSVMNGDAVSCVVAIFNGYLCLLVFMHVRHSTCLLILAGKCPFAIGLCIPYIVLSLRLICY